MIKTSEEDIGFPSHILGIMKDSKIRWIHLSDFHTGKDEYGQIKLFESMLKEITRKCQEGWQPDFVFITGDIANKGLAAEYELYAEEFLFKLPECLQPHFDTENIYQIPGNHDVDRTKNRTVDFYHVQDSVPDFFDPTPAGLAARQDILQRFENYIANDISSIGRKWLGESKGRLTTQTEIGGTRIGVCCINTAWISKGPLDEQKLIFGKDILEDGLNELVDCDAKIVLAHHPLDWMNPNEKDAINAILAQNQAIYLHGHLHRNKGSVGYGAGRQFIDIQSGACFQAREDEKWINRFIYAELDVANGFIDLEPMQWSQQHQEWGIDGTAFARSIQVENSPVWRIVLPFETSTEVSDADEIETEEVLGLIIDAGAIRTATADLLGRLNQLSLDVLPQNVAIRGEPRKHLQNLIEDSNQVWIVADWGANEQVFVQNSLAHKDCHSFDFCFLVDLESCRSIDDWELAAEHQIGLRFTKLLRTMADGNSDCCVVLANANPNEQLELDNGNEVTVERFIDLVSEYCSNCKFLVTSRNRPRYSKKVVELTELDLPDIKQFLNNHPFTKNFEFATETLERIAVVTGGLPVHLERFCSSMRYESAQSALSTFAEGSFSDLYSVEAFPSKLINAVNLIRNSQDKYQRRSYLLLEVLSLMPYGTTLTEVAKFDGNQPIYPRNVEELEDLGLIRVIASNNAMWLRNDKISETSSGSMLRVSKQVSDYVQSQTSAERKSELLRNMMTCLYGRKWREGNIRLSHSTLTDTSDSVEAAIANRVILVSELITSESHGNPGELGSCLRIAYLLAAKLKERHRYKEGVLLCKSVLNRFSTDVEHSDNSWLGELKFVGAKCLRMLGQTESAIEWFGELLNETSNSKERNADLNLGLALAHMSADEKRLAEMYANSAKELSLANCGTSIHCDLILEECKTENANKKVAMRDIEDRARKNRAIVVANNAALSIASIENDPQSRNEIYKRILSSNGDVYNRIRSIARLCEEKVSEGTDLTSNERRMLVQVFYYAHSQRLVSIHNQTHQTLWKLFAGENNQVSLIRLFRHSSFVWRLTGSDEKELRYARKLQGSLAGYAIEGSKSEFEYFENRRQILGIGNSMKPV